MEQPPKEEMVPAVEAIQIIREALNPIFMSRISQALREGMGKSTVPPAGLELFLEHSAILQRLKDGEMDSVPRASLNTFLQYQAEIERSLKAFEARN